MNITGQCHCKAIRFTALVGPSKVIACHCADCQTFSCAPFRAVVSVPVQNVEMTGRVQEYVKVADSGRRRIQAFCGTCGTQLYATEEGQAQVLNIRLGCVNERAQLPPTVQIWGQSAMPWLRDVSRVPFHTQGIGSSLCDFHWRKTGWFSDAPGAVGSSSDTSTKYEPKSPIRLQKYLQRWRAWCLAPWFCAVISVCRAFSAF